MDSLPPKPNPPGLAHIGQVIFAADGRARALIWQGRRYAVAGDTAVQQAVGGVARRANLYLDPATLALFDEARRPVGWCVAPPAPVDTPIVPPTGREGSAIGAEGSEPGTQQ